MSTFIALLRGINVGGKNRLLMKDLVDLLREVGCEQVRTYIQSGNAVFDAPAELSRQLPQRVPEALSARFGLRIPVIIRSARQLSRLIERNPFAGAPEKTLHVGFLARRPTAAQVASLDPDRSPPDRFEVHGCEVYFWCPGGVARSKFSNAYLDARLRTTTTVRSWRTVFALEELARG